MKVDASSTFFVCGRFAMYRDIPQELRELVEPVVLPEEEEEEEEIK